MCRTTDGFAIGLNATRAGIEPWPDAFVPEIEERPGEMTLRYPLTDASYTVRWDAPDYTLRELAGEDGVVLICGSLYLAGDVRLMLRDDLGQI